MKLLLAAALTMFSILSYAQTRIISVDAFDMACHCYGCGRGSFREKKRRE